MLANELAPGALAVSRSREQVVAAADLADGEVGATVAESEQFALDAAVAPSGVLASEAEDELVELGRSRSLATRTSTVGGLIPLFDAARALRPGPTAVAETWMDRGCPAGRPATEETSDVSRHPGDDHLLQTLRFVGMVQQVD
jgi:hypothetical protein